MSKPFGEPWERDGEGYYLHPEGHGYGTIKDVADRLAEALRFTDAELAAEFQSAAGDVYRAKAFHDDTGLAVQRFMTFRRFATTPGYAEVPDGLG